MSTMETQPANDSELNDPMVIKKYREALTKLMDEGFPSGETREGQAYYECWQKMAQFAVLAKGGKYGKEWAEYLSDEKNLRQFSGLAERVQGSKIADLMGEMGIQSDEHEVKAARAVGEAMRMAIQTDGGKIKDPQESRGWAERSREENLFWKTGQILVWQADMQNITQGYGRLGSSGEELEKADLLEEEANDGMMPEALSEWFKAEARDLRTKARAAVAAAPEVEAVKKESREVRVFGFEIMGEDELKSARGEIIKLLNERRPDSVFKAAYLMARFKQAGVPITIKKEKWEVFCGMLKEPLQEMRSKADPLKHARYLGFLKNLGVVKTAELDQQQDVEQLKRDLESALEDGDMARLESLALWCRSLGIIEGLGEDGRAKELWQKEIERKLEEGEDGAALLRTIGRAKYLGVLVEIDEAKVNEAIAAAKGMAKIRGGDKGWRDFLNMSLLQHAVLGAEKSEDSERVKAALYLKRRCEQAANEGKWAIPAEMLGDAVLWERKEREADRRQSEAAAPAALPKNEAVTGANVLPDTVIGKNGDTVAESLDPVAGVTEQISNEDDEANLGSYEEQKLFKEYVTEYGQLSPEKASLGKELFKKFKEWRAGGLFMAQVYSEEHGYATTATYDEAALKLIGNPSLYRDGCEDKSHVGSNNPLEKEKEAAGVTETVSALPLIRPEIVTEEPVEEEKKGLLASVLKRTVKQEPVRRLVKRPMLFKEVLRKANNKGGERAVRITYHASDFLNYRTNLLTTELQKDKWRQSRDVMDRTNGMTKPVTSVIGKPESLRLHMEDLRTARERSKGLTGRRGNAVMVSVILPESEANWLMDYLETHPNEARAFFLAGGLEHMAFHVPPPYEEWDKSQGEIAFRKFDGEGKLERPDRLEDLVKARRGQ